MYAHNQQHNQKSNKNNSKPHNKQNNKKNKKHRHHHHHHKGDGSGDGDDDDGGDDDGGDDSGGGGGVDDPSPVASADVPAPITILNSGASGQTVGYTLGSNRYSIAAGQSMAHNDGTQVIVFDRGGSFGQLTYTLQPGTYRFSMTSTGWDLRSVTEQVADNGTPSAK